MGKMNQIEQSAQNAFKCLEIKPGQELIIYADKRETKKEFADALEALAKDSNIRYKIIWTENFSGSDDEVISQLQNEIKGFYTADDPIRRNLIEFGNAGPIRNQVIKKFPYKDTKPYALSMPCNDVSCLHRLLGNPENDPEVMYAKAASLIKELNKAEAYVINSHNSSLHIPWNSKDAHWVISVGLIKRQNKKPNWGNCGGEMFSAVPEYRLQEVRGDLAIDGLVGDYVVPEGNIVYIPIRYGEIQTHQVSTKNGERPEELMAVFREMAEHERGLWLGEVPAIGLTYGVDAYSGEPLEVEKGYGELHAGIGDPEGERGTGPTWSSTNHKDVTMRKAGLLAIINNKLVDIVHQGEIVHPAYNLRL